MTTNLLVDTVWTPSILRSMVLPLFGAAFVAGAAQISVPMWPVPMTLQTLAVLAVGATSGARSGAATMLLYGIGGAIGLPIFAGGQAGFFKPDGTPISSGGYIIGFVLAAYVVGLLSERGWFRSIFRAILASLAGAVILYVPGVLWLAIWASFTQKMDMQAATTSALAWGLYPFMLGDTLKATIVALSVNASSRWLDRFST
jgi:biotin transport system substrate-specific component